MYVLEVGAGGDEIGWYYDDDDDGGVIVDVGLSWVAAGEGWVARGGASEGEMAIDRLRELITIVKFEKGKHFSRKVTPLFASMLVQPTEDESAPSERPSEAQPTPSPYSHDAQDMGKTRDVGDEEKENDEMYLSTEDYRLEPNSLDRQAEKMLLDDQSKDDETIAQVLLNMSQAKAVSREKEKGVESKNNFFWGKETDRPRLLPTRSLLTLKPLPKIDPKDKGKKKIEEEDESESESDGVPKAEKKFKQLASDEKWLGKYKKSGKARIEADRLLAEKLQEEEREQFYNKKKEAKFLHMTQLRSKKIPWHTRSSKLSGTDQPTKNQLKRYHQMMTYLKHEETSSILILNQEVEEYSLYEKIKRAFNYLMEIGRLTHGGLWYKSCGVCILEILRWNTLFNLVERRYPLSKDLLQRMLDLGLEVERESSVALDLIRSSNKKQRFKKLKERGNQASHTHKRTPKKVGYTGQVESFEMIWMRDASDQGGKVTIQVKSKIVTLECYLIMDMETVDGETVNIATTGVSAVSAPVTTVGVAISTAKPRTPPTIAATAFIDEDLTIA
ncbi:hypothetical protein Tco_0505905 [Tanacetum coccineum]